MSDEFPIGALVRKAKGPPWMGRVCGHYATDRNPDGVAVESAFHPGTVQIYGAAQLVEWVPTPNERLALWALHEASAADALRILGKVGA